MSDSFCRQVHSHLSEYRDRRLGADAASLIDEHLRSCASCRALSSDLERIARLAKRSENRLDEESLTQRLKHTLIENALEGRHQSRLDGLRHRIPQGRTLAAAGMGLVLLFTAYGIGRWQGRAERPNAQSTGIAATRDEAAPQSMDTRPHIPAPPPAVEDEAEGPQMASQLNGLAQTLGIHDALKRRLQKIEPTMGRRGSEFDLVSLKHPTAGSLDPSRLNWQEILSSMTMADGQWEVQIDLHGAHNANIQVVVGIVRQGEAFVIVPD